MFEQFLTKHVLTQLTTSKIPSIQNTKCINHKQKKNQCQSCVDVCFKEAITLSKQIEIDEDTCENCGGCVAVCPSGTFIVERSLVEKQLEHLQNEEPLRISCEKSEVLSDAQVVCLAHLPWELVATYALQKEVTLSSGTCSECVQATHVEELLQKVDTFYGRTDVVGFNSQLQCQQKEVSRRELFQLFQRRGTKLSTHMIPITTIENQNTRIYRDLLLHRLPDDLQVFWPSIQLEDGCWGCSICRHVCPQKAIKIVTEKNKRLLIHDHIHCTHCGLCESVCKDHAIRYEYYKASKNVKTRTFETSNHTCSICSDPLRVDESNPCVICQRGRKR